MRESTRKQREYIGGIVAERDALRSETARLRSELEKAVWLYENYGLVAGSIEGDPLAAGKWVNAARAALAAQQGWVEQAIRFALGRAITTAWDWSDRLGGFEAQQFGHALRNLAPALIEEWNKRNAAKLAQATEPAAQMDGKLDKPAQVGNTRFGIGVSERLVIERAQREHEYQNTSAGCRSYLSGNERRTPGGGEVRCPNG